MRALQYDQSRCRSAKDQYASEKAVAITTTRLPVINYMAGRLVVHCIVAQDVPTNGGAPPHLVGPRPTRRYATAGESGESHHVC